MEQNNNNASAFLTELAKKIEKSAARFADIVVDDDDLFDLPSWRETERQTLMFLNALNFLAPPCFDDDDDDADDYDD